MADEESTGASSEPLQPTTQQSVSKTSNFGAIVYVIWNLGLAAASIAVMISSRREHPNNGIRVWISIDALQAVVAVILFAVYEHQARTIGEPADSLTGARMINTLLYFVWWFVGIFWASSGSEIFFKNAPRLASWTAVLILIPPFLLFFAGCFACCTNRIFTHTPSSGYRSRRRRFRYV